MSAIKDAVIARVSKLQQRRIDVAARGRAEVADLDAQIAASQGLLANWDTLTIEQALPALQATGLRLRFDA